MYFIYSLLADDWRKLRPQRGILFVVNVGLDILRGVNRRCIIQQVTDNANMS